MTKAQRKKFIKDTFSATAVGVLLEDMQDGIKIIGEQHREITKKIDVINNKLDGFIGETRANFEAVFDYLSRKVLELEKKLEDCKKQQTALATKM